MASCRRYTEEWFPKLARALHLKDDWDYKELYLSLLEHLARQYKISRFKIYTPQELLLIIQRKEKDFSWTDKKHEWYIMHKSCININLKH